MVYFPVRKCYQATKLVLLAVLVVTILSLFEQWRGGKRNAKADFSDPLEAEYERLILEDESRIIPGLGEGGAAAHLIGEEKKLGEESEKKLAINVYLSDRIPYNRTLKDFRNPACKRVVYDAELPSASVILIFHNEPYSVVIRTIWSVVNSARRDQPWYKTANFVDRQTGRVTTAGYRGQDPSSSFVYLKEIILVDDNSTLPELKGKLSHYVRTRLPPDLIRILRLPDRVGLTRARLAGARYAVGDVVVFLDSHCEAQPDWMRPLLQTIKDYPHAVVVPIIDVIEANNFYYSVLDPSIFQVSVRLYLDQNMICGYNRQGLMLARLKGARVARGDVLIFLDAHCEGSSDWMRPLLERVKHKRDAVITPIIDAIHQTTFEFEASDNFQVGGFSFMGLFTWTDVPEREKVRRGSDIAPTWSPTMAGGLFAISRSYFWELGAYDEQMGGWGGENLEMSFRIWQCGGTLETIPCSRVGHVFRSFHPYGMPANTDTHGINTARMAEVWMDEYAELFYLHRPDLRNNPKIGDVTHRKILREKLKCKSFQWYLDNIYKEKFVPVREVYGYGRFKNAETSMCLDTLQREHEAAALGCYPCHPELQASQYFSFSLSGELRDEFNCASVQSSRTAQDEHSTDFKAVVMTPCHGKGGEQKWRRLSTGQLQHAESRLCLAAARDVGDVRAAPCRPNDRTQYWTIDYTEDNNFHASDLTFVAEREQRLNRLRGQRRISRSLLSYAEPASPADGRRHGTNGTERRRAHKKAHHKRHGRKRSHSNKKKIKNKFILKLLRTLMNGTEEHLEVDIHCKHKQLFPNNTFVRDLVTILNDKNVKVINNGRIFERNKVTELNAHSPHRVLNKMDIERPKTPEHSRGAGTKPNIREGLPKQHIKKQKPTSSSMISSKDITGFAGHKGLARIELKHGGREGLGGAREGRGEAREGRGEEREGRGEGRGKASEEREGRGAGRVGPVGGRGGPRGSSKKKIIIEDFVNVKGTSVPAAPARESKRKRKHSQPPGGQYTREVLQKQLFDKLGEDTGSAPRDSREGIVEHRYNDHTDGGNTDGGNTDGSNTDGGNTDGGNKDGRNTFGGNTDGRNTDGGNTDGGNTDGRNTDGGNTDGRNTDGGKIDAGDIGNGDKGGDSVENLLDDSMDRSAGREDWAIGESRFRRKSQNQPLSRNDSDINSHSSEKELAAQGQRASPVFATHGHRESGAVASQGPRLSQSASARASDWSGERPKNNDIEYTEDKKPRQDHWKSFGKVAPVKVVMRSNLTFNLGDEFFSWKNRATNDLVNDFLGELVIPSNSSSESARQPARMRTQPEPATASQLQSSQHSHSHSSQHSASHSDSSSDSSGD